MWRTSCAAMPNVPLHGPVPVVLFAHNVEHMIWKRLSQVESPSVAAGPLELEWRKMRRYEAQACNRASLTIAVSEVDRELLAANAPGARVSRFQPASISPILCRTDAREAPAHLVFTGSMDWYPNEDAILYFIEAILPGIRREIPKVSLMVVGRNPTPRLVKAAAAGARPASPELLRTSALTSLKRPCTWCR